jgi:hypothetical protein
LLPIERLREAAARLPIEMTPMFRVAPHASDPTAGDSTSEAAEAAGARAPGVSPTLLIEADGDRPGFGVFLVENLTGKPVSAPIGVSSFIGEQGHEVRPRLMLRPTSVSLGPGEQAIVQLAAELDEALEAGVRYHGEIAIPALSDRRIPIVLRRRAAGSAPEATAAKPRRANPAEPNDPPAAKPPRRTPVKRGAPPPATPPATSRSRRSTSSLDEPR